MREKVGWIAGIVEAVKRLQQILARKPCVPLRPLDACDLLLNSLFVSIRHRPRVGEEAAGTSVARARVRRPAYRPLPYPILAC